MLDEIMKTCRDRYSGGFQGMHKKLMKWKFGRVIEKGEIVEILNAEVKRISDVMRFGPTCHPRREEPDFTDFRNGG